MKNIGINARLLQKGKLEGIGRFSWEVIRRMISQNPNYQFTLFFDRPYASEFVDFPNAKGVYLGPQARHPLLYILWLEYSLAWLLKRHKPDILFCPDGFMNLKTTIPQIPVIHDLAFEHFPEGISSWGAWYYKKYMPLFAQKAKHILTVSEYSKQDISNLYSIDNHKITTVYNGAEPIFSPILENEKEKVRKRWAQGSPYIMYVGSIHPRKNLARLLQAFELFKQKTQSPHKLILTGRKAWNFEDVLEDYQNLSCRTDVIFTDFVTDAELAQLYGACDLFCYVSIFEGFGIPILEAMQSGTPVLYANTSSMPEVAGEAGIPIQPYNIEDIALGIEKGLNDKKTLIAKGLQQAQKFSWDKTYQRCWQVIESYM